MDSDGAVLSDGTLVPWHQILVAEHWSLIGPDGPLPVNADDLERQLLDYGQDWFLILSRLSREEPFQVTELLRGLQRRYQTEPTPSAGSIACHWILSRHLANQTSLSHQDTTSTDALEDRKRPGDESQPWLDAAQAWLTGQQQLRRARRDTALWPRIERWMPLYLDPDRLPLDQSLGLPLHAPPIPMQSGRNDRSPPRLETAQPEQGIYELVATIQFGNPADLAKVAERLDASLPDWPPARRPLVRHLRQTIDTLVEWENNPAHLDTDDVRFGYLESERRWSATFSQGAQSATPDNAMMTRCEIVWEVYLHGLYMAGHPDPKVRQSGRLRLLLLDYWFQQAPQLRRETTVLSPSLSRLLPTK
jgi:hypothetical protein